MSITLAIDCMGGDHGAHITVPAAVNYLQDNPDCHVILVGMETSIRAELNTCRADISARIRVQHASETVEMHESPSLALRNKKDSSMRVAINLVKEGAADACVSAGNTGALMATSRYVLKMLPGIDRPAIAAALPTMVGEVLVLDLGANVDCEAVHLFQFAVMGASLVAGVGQKDRPSIGLLNIGEEEIKGNDVVKQAAELLRASDLNFYGNIEGNDIYKGTTDIVVCDGFVGNVALKTSEGLIQMLNHFIREEFRRNVFTKLAALIALPVLNAFKQRVDHRRYNGASLLGLKGVVVKSHGSADVFAFENAIHRAADAVRNDVLSRITTHISQSTALVQASPAIQETVSASANTG